MLISATLMTPPAASLGRKASVEDRWIDQRLAARLGGLGTVALLELAAASRAAHPGFLHHDLAARQGHDRIARELAAFVGRVVAIVMEDRIGQADAALGIPQHD